MILQWSAYRIEEMLKTIEFKIIILIKLCALRWCDSLHTGHLFIIIAEMFSENGETKFITKTYINYYFDDILQII